MADTERIYTIPLRGAKNSPNWKRSKRAMVEVKEYLAKHMKTPMDKVKVDASLNETVWANGGYKPPSKVRVRAVKFEDGGVEAEFAGKR